MNLASIKTAKPGDVIWDKGSPASIKGLHLRVYNNGHMSFLLYYRNSLGVQRRPKIGDWPETTLADARSRAREIVDKVARGEDPQEDIQQLRVEPTVQELFDIVHEKYWGQQRYIDSGRRKEAKWAYDRYFKKRFGHLKVSMIKRKQIREWHEDNQDIPYAANRALEFLSTMFTYAQKYELVDGLENPCKLVDHYKEKKRTRYATPEELKKIAAILDQQPDRRRAAVAFIYTMMYAGPRPKFIEDAKWSDLTMAPIRGDIYGILVLSGKSSADSGEDEVVILPPQAMTHILQLPRNRPTIFGIEMPRRLWKEVREKAGCEDLRLRDLRRTYASVGVSNGVELDVIGELLNHRSVQTTKIYGKLMDLKRIEAAKKVADAVEGIVADNNEYLN
ncbi:integrase arm-type DNA-binding domain-containing protein [Bdellovibrio bacteriovorus]|uniref:integrase arm-type DNA-binding domain-containing protein n=1 Tax=Bdellovibrio bacteriovorus TaxID=959 RepID=UPI0035A7367B